MRNQIEKPRERERARSLIGNDGIPLRDEWELEKEL
jgi:hypothetical protein